MVTRSVSNPADFFRFGGRELEHDGRQRRDLDVVDDGRADLFSCLRAFALLVETKTRRLSTGCGISARVCVGAESSGLSDRPARNWQNFRGRGSVCIHRCIRADGYGLWARFCLELSEEGYKVCKMALAETIPEQPIARDPASLRDPANFAPVIDLNDLSVKFGGRPILQNLQGELRGRAIGLLGPNGAGKTTLIHTLLGFHSPSSGTAHIFGQDITSEAKRIRSLVGYMPERDSYIAKMSAVHFVRLMAELSGLPSEAALERAHEALFYVGLGEARYRSLDTYSLGMKQLAKLAQAIVHGPRLIFLDEPTNGLDPPARQRMIRLVREIRDSGKANILLSSHLLRDVEECCEEILILKEGRLAVYCNLEEERKSNRKFLLLETRGDQNKFAEGIGALGCEYAVTGDHRVKVVLQGGIEVRDVYRIASQYDVQIRRLSYKRDSLEDIFLKAMENGHGGL